MRFFLVGALGVILSGCATSRMPDTPLPLVTLGEVNDALNGRTALVHFTDGRTPARGEVTVGPEVSVIRNGAATQTIPTGEIETVTLDVSMSPSQGAIHGAGIGFGPAVAALAVGVSGIGDSGQFAGDPEFRSYALTRIGLITAVTAGAGAIIGAVTTTGEDHRVIYEAPVTRYPDAALVLVEGGVAAPSAASR